jgi:hypothetical protein
MSRGLGVMQRRILDALDVVGTMNARGPDGFSWDDPCERHRDFVDSADTAVDVSRIYIVRQVRHHLAHTMGKTTWRYGWDSTVGLRKPQWGRRRKVPSNCFQASFTRALSGLIARQVLRPVRPRWVLRARVEYVCKC